MSHLQLPVLNILNCDITFFRGWIDSQRLDEALSSSGGPHSAGVTSVKFCFLSGSKIMADAGVRILSIANQLSLTMRRVRLEFADGHLGTMGYLNRMGFFDHLAKEIEVHPPRPEISGAKAYRGNNAGVVEIARINPQVRDRELPDRLSNAVGSAFAQHPDVSSLKGAIWLVFAELIDNVFSHSATVIDGYAALQLYPNGNSLQVVVCDSGNGIMHTLRPSIATEFPYLAGLSDIELLVEVFKQGISRHGSDRGCGLKGCAQKAMKYNADLEVRLPQCRVLLVPSNGAYAPNTAYCYDNRPLVWGTHIAFRFHLDTA